MKRKPPPARPRSASIEISGEAVFTDCFRQNGKIKISEKSFRVSLQKRELVKRVRCLLALVCENGEGVSIRFADAAESLQLNEQYRQKDGPTDVLSFSAFEENRRLCGQGLPRSETLSLGDLCVCVPVCALQARENRSSLAGEMERMIVHGVCHLKGFDHERGVSAARVMGDLERALRSELVRVFGRPTWANRLEKK